MFERELRSFGIDFFHEGTILIAEEFNSFIFIGGLFFDVIFLLTLVLY